MVPIPSDRSTIASGPIVVETGAVHCPRDQAALRPVARKGTTIDVCTSCQGKWLDEGELEKLVLGASQNHATTGQLRTAVAAATRPNLFESLGSDPEIACPRCSVAMEKVRFSSGGAQLIADRCQQCGGYWLDAGETGALFVFLDEQLASRGVVWGAWAVAVGLLALVVYWIVAS